MHELGIDGIDEVLASDDLAVWVKLRHRTKAGKPTHRFKYEQVRLLDCGSEYDHNLRAWRVYGTRKAAETLRWLFQQSTPAIYVVEDWEILSAGDF